MGIVSNLEVCLFERPPAHQIKLCGLALSYASSALLHPCIHHYMTLHCVALSLSSIELMHSPLPSQRSMCLHFSIMPGPACVTAGC